jgi:hypothetical protein
MDNHRASSCPRVPRRANYFVVKSWNCLSRLDDKPGMRSMAPGDREIPFDAEGCATDIGAAAVKKCHL